MIASMSRRGLGMLPIGSVGIVIRYAPYRVVDDNLLVRPLDRPGEAVIHLKEVLRLKPDDEQVKEQLHRLGVQK